MSVSKREPWHPPTYEKEDIRAIQAIAIYAAGAAENPPSQQDCKRALDWIINHACGTYDEPFVPGQSDAVAYMLGRRSVGNAIIKLMRLKPEIFEHD